MPAKYKLYVVPLLYLAVFHYQPGLVREPWRVLVAACVRRFCCLEIVPLFAGYLTAAAARAQVGIEEYRVAHIATPS
jgi:hypothetical protein